MDFPAWTASSGSVTMGRQSADLPSCRWHLMGSRWWIPPLGLSPWRAFEAPRRGSRRNLKSSSGIYRLPTSMGRGNVQDDIVALPPIERAQRYRELAAFARKNAADALS